jgi:hypothetical protein
MYDLSTIISRNERRQFAAPGGNSALRAATRGNPRTHACPTCKTPNVLTARDVAKGCQCNACADREEGCGF